MKKEIIKIRFTDDDRAKRARKFSREIFGALKPTRVHEAEKGGRYTRKCKHKGRNDY